MWGKLISALLGIANKVIERLNRKQLIDAGKAEQVKKNLKKENENIKKAIEARRSASNTKRLRDRIKFRD